MIITRFCSGFTLPKTTVFKAAAESSSSERREASTKFSAPDIPAFFAIAETAEGLSPLITLIATSFLRKYSKVSAAPGRISSSISIKPRGFSALYNFPSNFAEQRASTRVPSEEYSSAFASSEGNAEPRTNSGAPIIYASSSNETAVYL